ncbi:hypothetical protein [Roseomonas chloroacetimidivorans]|uniref:hypothetical protein n=1 Tax=Roseomonas chloroacetimidivorans TaxID=1766656 RepID=UPI003C78BD2F
MREALTRLLFEERHPDLFALRHAGSGKSALAAWGFEHGDGWFAIIAALAEVVESRSPSACVVQCKEKFGTLRVYLRNDGNDRYCRGALLTAAGVSGRVSELSGRPGRMMTRTQSCPGGPRSVFSGVRTLAPAEAAGWEPAQPGEPDAPAGADELRARHLDILRGATIAVPTPCLGLIDAWLGALRAADAPPQGLRLARLGLDGDTAPVGQVGEEVLGATAFHAALGRRVDRRSGSVGPVDDRGRLLACRAVLDDSR